MKERTPGEGWSAAGSGARYRGRRWRSKRAQERDPKLVARLLRDVVHHDAARGFILDTPSGTGRLRGALEATGARYVGVELSADMQRHADDGSGLVRGDARHLPFADRTFDAVVCCRLLHHLRHDEERAALLAELVRVSRAWVLVSFWDAASWHAWRRRRGLRRAAHPDHRQPLERGHLRALLEAAGADPIAYRHSLRFVSPQAFVAARRRP